MAFEQHDMGGSLWANDRRSNDRQPTHTGTIKIKGVEYWMSAWVKEASNGKKFFGMAFTEKDEKDQPKGSAANPNKNSSVDDFDDDIPF